MPAHQIRDDDELQRLRNLGHGFIYNDYRQNTPSGAKWNVLHPAGCPHLASADTKTPKFFFGEYIEAVSWLRRNRVDYWTQCTKCPGQNH